MKRLMVKNSKIYKVGISYITRMFPGDLERSPDDFILRFLTKLKSEEDWVYGRNIGFYR